MRTFAGSSTCLAFVLIGLLNTLCGAFSDQAKLEKDSEQRILAILDPIDLHTQRVDQEWGEFIRKSFTSNPHWKVLSRDTMLAKFKDYKLDARIPCHEFQCAFDAGNILSAEFVMFGSVTSMDDLYAFTLNLVHVPTSQTVWSRVGEIRKKQLGIPSAAMEATLAQIAGDLGPDQVRTGRRDKRGLLTVLDLSAAGSTPSRIMAERVATHLYASRNYDIMGRKEMEELLKALDINKGAFNPTDTGIYSLGGKMDITHLVYSRLLATRDGGMQLQLALYDIAAKKKVREWPSQSTMDFRRLLEFEDKFFSSLFKLPEYEGGTTGIRSSGHWTWAGAGLSLAMGAVFGYLSYAASQDADREYAKFQDARSREMAEAQQVKVQDKEHSSVLYGVLGGVSLAGAGGFLVFSF
ncbi:MAG: hypothetical protein JWO30_3151 [Fibrobacteres bacterium]|nr:hypothetical protein [Fibrobacterota bacterium]